MDEGTGVRIHSMDALRASTMLLLVPIHGSTLVALNGHEGAWATAIYWILHLFRLPLFFAMSGFFLALTLRRRGTSKAVRNRAVRIVVPLLLGLVTLVPLTVLAAQGTGTVIAVEQGPPGGSPFTFEPGFLWFLWYLLIIDCAALALYLGAPRLLHAAGDRFAALIARPLGGILLLAVPTTLALWPAQSWTAIAPGDTFVPAPAVLAYYSLFFALGATLYAHRGLAAAAGRNAWRWTACALAATLPAALLFSFHNTGYGTRPAVHAAALLIYSIATWTSLIALVGLANRYLNRPRPALRYLADSSYWIYLSHLPAMVLAVGLVGAASLGAAPQFALVTAIALAFSLITYPLFVRYTAIGRVLNGPRTRPGRGGPLLSRPAIRGIAGASDARPSL